MKEIIIIAGPTGVGKSEVAIDLAKKLRTEIISADSVQIYKDFTIGSGKILPEDQEGIPHHLLDFLHPLDHYSVQHFQKDAKNIIRKLHKEGKIPIVCGGSNLYIHSLIYDLDFSKEKIDMKLRVSLEKMYENFGTESLFELLTTLDPKKAEIIDRHNHRRIIRAIEMAKAGKKDSDNKFRHLNNEWNSKYFVLNRDRQNLYDRINSRVLKMINKGLFEEVEFILKKYGEKASALNTIGYKEVVKYFRSEYSETKAIEKIQQHSRNFAKRQLTWYRKEQDAQSILCDGLTYQEISNKIFYDYL